MNRFLTIFILLCISQNAYTQKLSWRKLKKLATKYASEQRYDDAADHFLRAYKLNASKKDLLFQAANNYYKISDYVNAADAYAQLQDDFAKFPKADLRYAYSLKQDGQYEEAILAFANFENNYTGTKKAMWRQLVANEIKGCELGQALNAENEKGDIEIAWLNGNVNTIEMETAPLLFGDDLLYYTSTIGTTQGIYRSQRLNGDWQTGQAAEGLPEIEGDFGNGAFSPTKERFYFTTCKDVEIEKGVTKNICQLSFIQQTSNGWSAPTPLPQKVNALNATCTHPTVVHMLEKEVIFFSSDRKGGKGGFDIWYTTTAMDTDSISTFTSPNNLGRMVNSVRDDVTPFYDVPTQTLYFSSNGYPSIGGFDIYASTGDLVRFEEPIHMGKPINSEADDLFYITSPVSETNGLFVSNRMFGDDKIHTKDLDIFEYRLPEKKLMVKGTIFEKATKEPIKESKVALYEILKSGKKRLLSKIDSKNGAYQFKLLPNRKFVVESDKDGYPTASQAFNTLKLDSNDPIEKDIFIDKHGVQRSVEQPIYSKAVISKPKVVVPQTTPKVVSTPAPKPAPKVTTPTNTTRTIRDIYPPANTSTTSVSSFSDSSRTSNAYDRRTKKARMPKGEFYKIQLIAVRKYNPNHKRYREVKEMARLESEYIPFRDLERVMMGDYFSLSIAKRKLESVRSMTDFTDAYIVRYKNGRRMGVIK